MQGDELDEVTALQYDFLDKAGLPVFVKNQQGVYIHASSHFVDLIGKPKNKIVGHTAFEIAPAHLARGYTAADNLLFDVGGVQNYTSSVVISTGTPERVVFTKYKIDGGEDGNHKLLGTLKVTPAKVNSTLSPSPSVKLGILSDQELSTILDETKSLSNELSDKSAIHKLTTRELQGLRLISQGYSTKKISHQLALSDHTVNDYIKALRYKFGVQSKVQLILKAHHLGML